jgi:hypothetical protein
MNSFRMIKLCLLAVLLSPLLASAQLAVSVSPPKITGTKALIKLEIKNTLSEAVQSARASVFLLDAQNQIIGQATKWVIGGTQDKPALAPEHQTTYNFVVQATRPFPATNLTAQVSFSRVVLAGGKLADALKDVSVTTAGK